MTKLEQLKERWNATRRLEEFPSWVFEDIDWLLTEAERYDKEKVKSGEITWAITERTLDITDDEIEYKLSHLLMNHVIFCNNGWWWEEKGISWPKDYITHHVNCNDVFAWGCADAEDITHEEIHGLYTMWLKDPSWGPAIWCIKKRKCKPQEPVEKEIRRLGVWNLDEIYTELGI